MLNSCNFIGNLGADPDIRRTADGKPVANLRLAVTEKWKSKDGERKERTEWVRVVVFSEGLCRVCEAYLNKGSKIFVSGKLQTRKYQDQAGQDRFVSEIVLQGYDSKLVMLDSKGQSDPQPSGGGEIEDEIPFNKEWRA